MTGILRRLARRVHLAVHHREPLTGLPIHTGPGWCRDCHAAPGWPHDLGCDAVSAALADTFIRALGRSTR